MNFLVFTRAGRRLGLVRELAHIAYAMGSKADDCVVFDQVADGRSSLPDLSQCDLRNARIYQYKFRDEAELRDGLLTRAQYYVVLKQDMLAKRPSR